MVLTLHVIAAELAIGALSLAFTVVLSRLVLNRIVTTRTRFVRERPWVRSLDETLRGAAFLAAVFGTAALVTAGVSGFFVWPLPTLLASPVIRNKMFFGLLSVGFWVTFLVFRGVFGPEVWRDRLLAYFTGGAAAGGFVTMAVTASLAGHLGGKVSLVELALGNFGATAHELLTIPSPLSYGLIAAMLAVTAATFMIGLRQQGGGPGRKNRDMPLHRETRCAGDEGW